MPEPSALTPASGIIVYRLLSWSNSGQQGEASLPIGYQLETGHAQGIVAIRVNDDATLSLELFPGVSAPAAFAGFTPAVRTYRR